MPPTILTDLERVWLAAIMDGEGSFRIARTRRKDGGRGWRFQPTIELTNTDVRLIDRFVELAKPWVTRVREYENNHFHDNAKKRHQVEIRYRKCEPFLRAIRPFLVCKGDQADLLLEFLDLQAEKGKSGENMVEQYNELYIKGRILNLRGVKPLDVDKLRQDIAA